MNPWIIITVISLICSALFSGTEIAYITADRVRTQIDVKRGGLLGNIIRRFYSNSEFSFIDKNTFICFYFSQFHNHFS